MRFTAGRDEARAGTTDLTPSIRWILASLSLSMLLSSIGTSIANVSLPTLAQAFDASFQQVQWVVIAYLVTITTVIVSVGRFGDMTGRRRLLLIGVSLFTFSDRCRQPSSISPTCRAHETALFCSPYLREDDHCRRRTTDSELEPGLGTHPAGGTSTDRSQLAADAYRPTSQLH